MAKVNIKFPLVDVTDTISGMEPKVLGLKTPNKGGAPTLYVIRKKDGTILSVVSFQNQPTSEGLNGIFDVSLLSILRSRFEGFTKGPFACEETKQCLQHIESCIELLRKRHQDRVNRGVFDKQEK